mgnify:CR=1 FL=1
MVFEKLIRYIGLAVGLKPSAMGCEARLRGLERIIFSKTILPSETRRGRDALASRLVEYLEHVKLPKIRITRFLWGPVAPRPTLAVR